MIKEILARRYAKALIGAAFQDEIVERITEELSGLVDMLTDNMELQQVLYNPAISPLKKIKILNIISEKARYHEILSNLLTILTEKGRTQIIPDIYKSYNELLDEKREIITAKLTCAEELTKKEIDKIVKQLERISGKHVHIDMTEDDTLIAGVKVEMAGVVYDGSVKNKLAMLRKELTGD